MDIAQLPCCCNNSGMLIHTGSDVTAFMRDSIDSTSRFRWLITLLLSLVVSACASTSSPYGAPPDTSDPWQLVHNARNWLQQGRPRAAMPSLEKALVEVEGLDPKTSAYAHAKAAIYNELGRVYEMTSELDLAEAELLKAAEVAERVPERRPLHFDISYNLSTVYERKAKMKESCTQLQRTAALYRDLLVHPAEPPDGYGSSGERFLNDVAAPKIRARAQRIGCAIKLTE
jgi:tetratricopeptide (TPR) repeat protein